MQPARTPKNATIPPSAVTGATLYSAPRQHPRNKYTSKEFKNHYRTNRNLNSTYRKKPETPNLPLLTFQKLHHTFETALGTRKQTVSLNPSPTTETRLQ
jgi:hypothetical protein